MSARTHLGAEGSAVGSDLSAEGLLTVVSGTVGIGDNTITPQSLRSIKGSGTWHLSFYDTLSKSTNGLFILGNYFLDGVWSFYYTGNDANNTTIAMGFSQEGTETVTVSLDADGYYTLRLAGSVVATSGTVQAQPGWNRVVLKAAMWTGGTISITAGPMTGNVEWADLVEAVSYTVLSADVTNWGGDPGQAYNAAVNEAYWPYSFYCAGKTGDADFAIDDVILIDPDDDFGLVDVEAVVPYSFKLVEMIADGDLRTVGTSQPTGTWNTGDYTDVALPLDTGTYASVIAEVKEIPFVMSPIDEDSIAMVGFHWVARCNQATARLKSYIYDNGDVTLSVQGNEDFHEPGNTGGAWEANRLRRDIDSNSPYPSDWLIADPNNWERYIQASLNVFQNGPVIAFQMDVAAFWLEVLAYSAPTVVISGIDIALAPDDGGIEVTATGTFAVVGPIRVRAEHADGTARYCYSGVIGQGYDIPVDALTTEIAFILPPMPLGDVDLVFVDTDTGSEVTEAAAIEVIHRTYTSMLANMRTAGGSSARALGPRDLLSED